MLVAGMLVVVWVGCGAIAYAGWFAHFQGAWPRLAERDYHLDRLLAVIVGLCGPIGLFAVAVCFQFEYGLKWR